MFQPQPIAWRLVSCSPAVEKWLWWRLNFLRCQDTRRLGLRWCWMKASRRAQSSVFGFCWTLLGREGKLWRLSGLPRLSRMGDKMFSCLKRATHLRHASSGFRRFLQHGRRRLQKQKKKRTRTNSVPHVPYRYCALLVESRFFSFSCARDTSTGTTVMPAATAQCYVYILFLRCILAGLCLLH